MTTDHARLTPLAFVLALIAILALPTVASQTDCSLYGRQLITFDVGTATPKQDIARELRNSVYHFLWTCPEVGLVLTGTVADGETDSLAARRAEVVAAALVADGFSPDRFATDGGGVGEGHWPRAVTMEAVTLEALPGWTPRGPDHEPDPVRVELWQDSDLWLDWTVDPGRCAVGTVRTGEGALRLHVARYGDTDLDAPCVRARPPVPRYVPTGTAEVVPGVIAIDGSFVGADGGTLGVGWLVGPSGTVQTDGRFCARYRQARRELGRALGAQLASPGDASAEAEVGAPVDALAAFGDATVAVGGDAALLALDCRRLTFQEYSL